MSGRRVKQVRRAVRHEIDARQLRPRAWLRERPRYLPPFLWRWLLAVVFKDPSAFEDEPA